MNIVGLIVGALIGSLFSGFIIWVVGKLGLGIKVDGFGPAFLAAFVIAILNAIVGAIVPSVTAASSVWLAMLVNLVLSAVVLLVAGGMIKGLQVKGFLGAIVAAVAIALVTGLLGLGLAGLLT